MKSLIIGYGTTGKSFEKFLSTNSISFDIFDEDKTKLENKKNILDCLNDESISDYVNLYISPGIQLKKYFSTGIRSISITLINGFLYSHHEKK